jgi:hypothetical protein
MGLNGVVSVGRGILVNPHYMPPQMLEILNRLDDVYDQLFQYSRTRIINERVFVVWCDEPTVIFPVESTDRRPHIIKEDDGAFLQPSVYGLTPTDSLSGNSCEGFIMVLMEYLRSSVTASCLVDEALERLSTTVDNPSHLADLRKLLKSEHTLVGRLMVYTVEFG